MEKQPFSLKMRLKSFGYAWNGIRLLFRNEHNARIHLIVFLLVVLMGIYFHLALAEWLIILLVSGMVFAAEAFNAALEKLADEVSEQQREKIGKAKDLAAGAVLISAIVAVMVGLIIFLPKVFY